MSDSEEEKEHFDFGSLDSLDIICDDHFPFIFSEDYEKFGFNLKLLKRDELNINLIHFDLKMTTPENYKYYINFKVDVVGEYFAIDNIEILKKILEVIKHKNIPLLVISSGSSGEDVIKICKNYSFIKEVIIFCGNYEYNKHYMKDYKGYVKKVLTSIKEVYKYLKSFKFKEFENGIEKYKELDSFIFSYDDFKMNKQLEQIPAISALEYDNCYFLIHRAYAHYFGKMDDKTNTLYEEIELYKFEDYLRFFSYSIDHNSNKILIRRLRLLIDKENFEELAIREYLTQNGFCYFFNREMRKFNKELFPMSYFMGPLLFGMYKYVND